MSFKGNGQRLVGDDGLIKKAAFGAKITGAGTTPLPVGTYMVLAVAVATTLPDPAGTGGDIAPGDILVIRTGDSVTPAVGDNLVTLTLTTIMDVSSWTMEFSKEEIDVTVLADAVKKYRSGKADMSGTLEGVFVMGTTDEPTGFMRQFIDIAQQDGDLSFDKYDQQEEVLLGFFQLQKNSSLADIEQVVAPFQLYGNGMGGALGERQGYSSPFRFASLAFESVEINPTLYRLGDGTV
jgi:hypothetical protein